jgi:hypothetical protein
LTELFRVERPSDKEFSPTILWLILVDKSKMSYLWGPQKEL